MVLNGASDRTVLFAGLAAILALSVASATVDSAVVLNPGDVQGGTDARTGGERVSPPVSDAESAAGGGGRESGSAAEWSVAGVSLTTCVPFLSTGLGVLSALASFFALLFGVVRLRGLRSASLAGYALGPAWFFGYFLLTDCSSGAAASGGPLGADPLAGVGGGGLAAPRPSPLLVGGGLGVVGLLVGALLYVGLSGEEEFRPPADEERDEDRVDELASAAGRAADRIADRDVAVDNAVYRAWSEMAGVLDLDDPETSTTGEFAAAAVEAGLDAHSVARLTRLFDEVRYGEMDPSEREDAALACLRSIEAEYGGDGPDGSADGESGGEQ